MNNQKSNSADHFPVVIEFYRGYAERNKTFEDFSYDVNTLGGTLEWDVSHIDETTRTHSFVSDWKFKPVARYLLKDIWNAVKGEQISLF